ncbi:MAG: dihydropteroate synthase [Proteobacteria bacterium]|nr:dihydropteroate synthase [Pseudomonadota bacterium]
MEFLKIQNSINCHGQLIDLTQPIVMGIVNLTPDSFYKGSRFIGKIEIIERVKEIISQGGKIVDIGAYSSRPGAENISEYGEWERLKPALESIRESFPDVLISVDTFRSSIAEKSVSEFKANIINDISGGEQDTNMFATIGELQVPYILMHMQGNPQTMQDNPHYKHLIQELLTYFAIKKEKLYQAGVKDIIIDPGFGFGKTMEHNFEIINRLEEFNLLELPLLVGVSRKSMIFKLLDTTPSEALNGTTVLNTIALTKGAKILRVHDVKEAVEAVKLVEKVAL